MNKYENELLDDLVAGRRITGMHISFEAGIEMKADWRYGRLSHLRRDMLENLIEPIRKTDSR